MRIPRTGAAVTAVKHLHEAYAALHEPPSRQTQLPKIARRRMIQAIESLGGFRFALELEHFRQGGLHSEGQLVRFDARTQGRVVGVLDARKTIESAEQIELGFLLLAEF